MADRIVSKPSTSAYREGWERLWGAKEPELRRFTLGGFPIETDPCVPVGEIWMRYSDGSIGPTITGIDYASGPDACIRYIVDGDGRIVSEERDA